MIERLDHINLRTGQLDAMVAWYTDVLGMTSGPRPNFGFPGAWMYAGDHALVHLVEVQPSPADPGTDLKLEHGAFQAKGLKGFLERLDAKEETYRIARIPDFGILQVNVWDPDGNHLHIDFAMAEEDA